MQQTTNMHVHLMDGPGMVCQKVKICNDCNKQEHSKMQSRSKNRSRNNGKILRTFTMAGNMLKSRLSNFKNGSSSLCGRNYMQPEIATVLLQLPLPMLVLLLLLLLSAMQCVVAVTNNEGSTSSSTAGGNARQGHSLPHFKPNRSSIVQLFEWKFVDVAEECKSFLSSKGYGGVQLSPVTEHLVFKSDNVQHPWWERYHPISYEISSRSGNMEDFLHMSRQCNDAGIRIYVDVVLNHMAASFGTATTEVGSAGSEANASALDYPAVPYSQVDFHTSCQLRDYTVVDEVRNCQFDGRPDLDHSRANVRERVVELLNKLVDMGAAGFRVDAAKYMWPEDLKEIYGAVKDLNSEDFDFPAQSRPFFYQEIVDLGTEVISKAEYSGIGVVTEYLYAAELATIFNGAVPLGALINWGPAMGFSAHHDAMVFIDTHDSQRGALKRLGENHLLTHKQRAKYIMANVFMLAHPYGGIKRIMSSYHFEEDTLDNGPPTEGGGDDVSRPQFDENGQCTVASGWVCEHRWTAIANMVALANSLDEQLDGVINFQTYGPQHIAFCRGQKAFFAFNNDAKLDYRTEVFTCLEVGVYCDIITGGRKADGTGCLGKPIVVDTEGMTNIMLPVVDDDDDESDKVGVVAICVDSKVTDATAAVALAKGIAAAPQEERPTSEDVKSEYEVVPDEIMAEHEQEIGNKIDEEEQVADGGAESGGSEELVAEADIDEAENEISAEVNEKSSEETREVDVPVVDTIRFSPLLK